MSRRARPAPKPASPPGERPFAGLRALLAPENHNTPRTKRPRPAASEAASPAPAAAPPGTPDADDCALFRNSVGPTSALRASHRIEIERPRPPPLPRPRAPEEAGDDIGSSARARPATDPLSAAYEGVTPLPAHGRVDLSASRRPIFPGEAAGRDDRPGGRLVLPPDADLHDAGTLFLQVIGDTRPLRTANRVELPTQPPLPLPVKRDADERSALDESLSTPPTFEDRLDMGDEAAFLRPGLPRRVLTDLRRGRWVLQGQIDLHGFNRDEARAALATFLRDSLQQGRRCIRVIHGKGLGSPGRISILKQLSRGWLAQREEILAFCQAGPRDGGEGALLVLMRAQHAAPA